MIKQLNNLKPEQEDHFVLMDGPPRRGISSETVLQHVWKGEGFRAPLFHFRHLCDNPSQDTSLRSLIPTERSFIKVAVRTQWAPLSLHLILFLKEHVRL